MEALTYMSSTRLLIPTVIVTIDSADGLPNVTIGCTDGSKMTMYCLDAIAARQLGLAMLVAAGDITKALTAKQQQAETPTLSPAPADELPYAEDDEDGK